MNHLGRDLDILLIAVCKNPAMAHVRFLHGSSESPYFTGFRRCIVQQLASLHQHLFSIGPNSQKIHLVSLSRFVIISRFFFPPQTPYEKFPLRKYLDLVKKEIHLLPVSLLRIHLVIGLMNPAQAFHSAKGESRSSAKLIQIMFSRLTLLSTCCCMIPSMNVDLPQRLTPTQILAFRGSVSLTKSRGLPGSRHKSPPFCTR